MPRIAIIGCGTVAQRYYAPLLRVMPRMSRSLLLVDRNRKNAETMQALAGGGEIHEDYRDVLMKAEGAVVLLPHVLHFEASLAFLEAGRHVLCEKPLAVLPDEARELVRAAEEKGAALCVNNTRRMFPQFRAARRMMTSGELGRPRRIIYQEGSAFGWPSSTGFYVNPDLTSKGVLLDLGSHVMDTVCWWAGGRPELEECIDDSHGGPESVVKIRARREGCTIEVLLNRLCELRNFFRIELEHGTIEGGINDWQSLTVNGRGGNPKAYRFFSPSKTYPGFVKPILMNFLKVVEGKEIPFVAGQDVLPSIDLIHECYGKRKHFDNGWEKVRWPGYPARSLPVNGGKRNILVTGATGFIGGRLVEMLHFFPRNDCTVVAGIRQWSSAARLGRLPVSTVKLDLLDKDQIDRALDGITHVVHCAKGTPEATVNGTRNLLEACLAKGVRHVIHLSTAEVYGNASGLVDEQHPCQYTGNAYNRMKIDAEKVCLHYQDRGLPLTVFRPSIVYGPFSSSWSLRFAAFFLAGEWGIYEGHGEGACNLVYVDDLVRVMLDSLDHEAAIGRAFNVNGPEVISWNDYFLHLNHLMGLPPLKVISRKNAGASSLLMDPVRTLGGFVKRHFLKPVKKAAETFAFIDSAMRAVEHRVKTTPAIEELKLFSRNAVYSDALARSTLPYCPDTTIEEGMKSTLAWLRYLGLLQDPQ